MISQKSSARFDLDQREVDAGMGLIDVPDRGRNQDPAESMDKAGTAEWTVHSRSAG
jgi:hypothetical protein